jgi:DNA-binding phage protein
MQINSPNSLKRLLSVEGNPRVDDLFAVIAQLKASEGVSLSVRACADKP